MTTHAGDARRRHRTGHRTLVLPDRANSSTFIDFLEQVWLAYPSAPAIAIVLDNVGSHSSRAVRRWLASHDRVKLLYGARYCTHRNPVERVWGAMKTYLPNLPTLTMQGRLNQVHAFSCSGTPAQMLVTAAPFNSPWLPPSYGQELWRAA